MERNFLEFGLPVWWILPAIAAAVAMAFLLYSKKGMPWSKNQNLLLGTLRFLAIFIMLLLFLNPFINTIQNDVERPILVIGVDNTSSIASIHSENELNDLVSKIQSLKEELSDDKDYDVRISTFSKDDTIAFDHSLTDLSAFFREVNKDYSGTNLAGVVLLTDGIYNRGSSPEYNNFSYPIFSVGLGDTIPQRDIAITRVRHNEIAYSGNEFPVEIKFTGQGYVGEGIDISILEKGSVLQQESLVIESGENEHLFFLNAEKAGLRHYTVRMSMKDGEATYANNAHEVFVEILESKKKILIAGQSPHPDMRAIRSVLEATGNYEVIAFIEGIHSRPEEIDFDVEILFDGMEPISSNSGVWVVKSGEDDSEMPLIPNLKIKSQGSPDNVTPTLNLNFTSFKLNRETQRLKGYPPVLVPFGEYEMVGPHEILLFQQFGSVVTDKPLLGIIDAGGRKKAFSVGLGFWQWKLQEAARYGDHQLFTEMVQKLVQYLSLNEKKKQFRVNQGLDIFSEGEVVFFDVEIYDDIYQSLEAQPYSITISDEYQSDQSYEFVYGSDNKIARTTSYAPGTYTYSARTKIGDKSLVEYGEFLVNSFQLELSSLTADHSLLKNISDKSGGKYFHVSEWKEMKDFLDSTDFPGVIHTDENKHPLIGVLWVLLLIVGLLTAEWVLRKAWGAY